MSYLLASISKVRKDVTKGGKREIGHFQVSRGLCFKTRVVAQPLIWKSFFILIFTRKVVRLASF